MIRVDPVDWDPLHRPSRSDRHWTTSNVGEAVPGVMTPLCASIWAPAGEKGLRQACYELGIVDRSEAVYPEDESERWVSAFYGRLAMQIEFMAMVGDRLPGTSGAEAVRGVFGRVPETMEFRPTRSRYLSVAWRWPRTFRAFPARMRAMTRTQTDWWRSAVDRVPSLDLDAAVALLFEADARFNEAESLQTISVFGIVQPTFEALTKVVARAGTGDIGVLSGSGHAESEFVTDIWRASRNEIAVDEVVRRHGYHGPREGELSATVWREDPTPIHAMVAQYAARPDGEDPRVVEQERNAKRLLMVGQVLAALPRRHRPGAKLILRLAQERIPMRGVVKTSFVQALDVARAAARRIGEHLVAQGRATDPDDAFFLTLEEFRVLASVDVREVVAARRQRWESYQQVTIPREWRGNPVPEVSEIPVWDGTAQSVSGIGVSAGVVTARARVIVDPDFAEVEPDEILIAPTTDPSWASIMFLSAGLVVDIGGALSHAAVVARELGIPCVVNTIEGTQIIRTGDLVKVDGKSGVVEILERAPVRAGEPS